MVCDIHLVLEKRVKEGGWVAVDTFRGHHVSQRTQSDFMGWKNPVATERNYERFAKLAGVRGPGPGAIGLPTDISQTARVLSDDYGEDGHSHSWLPLSDAVPIFDETECWRDFETPDNFCRKYPASFFFGVESANIDVYRIVFWFDN